MGYFDYKSLSIKELISLYKDYYFRVKPLWHQFISLTFTLNEDINRVSYPHDVGTGKTITSLLTTQTWNCSKILVVCPTSAFGSWERDIKLATNYSFTYLIGTKTQRLSNLGKKKDIFIINYEGLKTIYAELRKINRETKRKWRINHISFIHNFDCIIFDEIHRCKNYNTIQSKIC